MKNEYLTSGTGEKTSIYVIDFFMDLTLKKIFL